MTYTPTNFERAMARHVITLGLESGTYDEHVDDSVDYPIDADRWSIEEYDVGQDDDEPFVDVRATYKTTVAGEKTAAKTRRHPAEYEQHDVTVVLLIKFWPNRNGGFGESDMVIEQEGGAPSEASRDYDPYDECYSNDL